MGMVRTLGYLIVLIPMTLILSLLLWVVVGQPSPGALYYTVCYLPLAACIGFCGFIGFQDPPLNSDD